MVGVSSYEMEITGDSGQNAAVVLVNSLPRLMTVTDVKIAGVSVIDVLRRQLLTDGRLEDPDDAITLLPGESLAVAVSDGVVGEFFWMESRPDGSY